MQSSVKPADSASAAQEAAGRDPIFAFGVGVGTRNRRGEWLEVFYPQPVLRPHKKLAAALRQAFSWQGGNLVQPLTDAQLQELRRALPKEIPVPEWKAESAAAQNSAVLTALAEDAAPVSTPEAYLKLHLLSWRLCRPNELNLDGLFALLPNVAWTSEGPVDLEELPHRRLKARQAGRFLHVHSVDKFPPLCDYATPSGVRIADGARVRLGAFLGEGVTVMHEGFVNFNAGAEGPNMVEGRISAGVTVGAGSDLGGGSSIMGTLSGGNRTRVSIGRNCLVGANGGVGVPLGDNCVIEAGLYVTAGAVVAVLDADGAALRHCKARELAGQSNLLFRRNSQSGALECLPNPRTVELNPSLHEHN